MGHYVYYGDRGKSTLGHVYITSTTIYNGHGRWRGKRSSSFRHWNIIILSPWSYNIIRAQVAGFINDSALSRWNEFWDFNSRTTLPLHKRVVHTRRILLFQFSRRRRRFWICTSWPGLDWWEGIGDFLRFEILIKENFRGKVKPYDNSPIDCLLSYDSCTLARTIWLP